MSLSSKKSNFIYNRALEKEVSTNTIIQETTYDPREWTQDSCDHHSCEWCNPPLRHVYFNRIIFTLYRLNVISSQKAEELYIY